MVLDTWPGRMRRSLRKNASPSAALDMAAAWWPPSREDQVACPVHPAPSVRSRMDSHPGSSRQSCRFAFVAAIRRCRRWASYVWPATRQMCIPCCTVYTARRAAGYPNGMQPSCSDRSHTDAYSATCTLLPGPPVAVASVGRRPSVQGSA
jgi:hypothetical protein